MLSPSVTNCIAPVKIILPLLFLFSVAYGATELGLSHFGRNGDCRSKSVGKLLDLTEIKVKSKML